jgi:hypothetical protein
MDVDDTIGGGQMADEVIQEDIEDVQVDDAGESEPTPRKGRTHPPFSMNIQSPPTDTRLKQRLRVNEEGDAAPPPVKEVHTLWVASGKVRPITLYGMSALLIHCSRTDAAFVFTRNSQSVCRSGLPRSLPIPACFVLLIRRSVSPRRSS